MMRKQSLYIDDIIKSIEAIINFTGEMTFNSFIEDDKTFSAVIRKIEIIGEASKNVSSEIKESNQHIPWSMMARMRDKLIHGYFGVDADIIWKTAKEQLPQILPLMIALRNSIKD